MESLCIPELFARCAAWRYQFRARFGPTSEPIALANEGEPLPLEVGQRHAERGRRVAVDRDALPQRARPPPQHDELGDRIADVVDARVVDASHRLERGRIE